MPQKNLLDYARQIFGKNFWKHFRINGKEKEFSVEVSSSVGGNQKGFSRRDAIVVIAVGGLGTLALFLKKALGQFAPSPRNIPKNYVPKMDSSAPPVPFHLPLDTSNEDRFKAESDRLRKQEEAERANREQAAAQQRLDAEQSRARARAATQKKTQLPSVAKLQNYVSYYLDRNIPRLVEAWSKKKRVSLTFSGWTRRRVLPSEQLPSCLDYMLEEYLARAFELERENNREALRKELGQAIAKTHFSSERIIPPSKQYPVDAKLAYGQVLDCFTIYFVNQRNGVGRDLRTWVLQRERGRGGPAYSQYVDDALHKTHRCLQCGEGHFLNPFIPHSTTRDSCLPGEGAVVPSVAQGDGKNRDR